jgi:hypothetical protein
MRLQYIALPAFFLLLLLNESQAQDLDPRAYARIPVNVTVVVAGFGYSQGGIVTDATLPVKDLDATIISPSLGIVHSFGFLGRTAQVSAALPYAWGDVTAMIAGEPKGTTRSGFSDMRLRFNNPEWS